MRTSILTAAVAAAALALTTPDTAKAQIIVYPQISSYPSLYTPGYYNGSYYNYNYVNPISGWGTNSYGWSNPYNYGNYRYSYPTTPYYSGYRGYSGYGGYYGVRGRRW